MNNNEDQNGGGSITTHKQLYEKIAAEYGAYLDKLREKTPDEILNAAYEKVCKEEIVAAIDRGEFSDAGCAGLYQLDDLLDCIYLEWLSTDATDMDEILTVIEEMAANYAEHTPAEIISFPTETETPMSSKTLTPGEQLYNKLSAEYDAFITGLQGLPPRKIIDSAYEKVFKEDILMCFEDSDDLNDRKIAALLALDAPLDELYRNWLDTDVSYMDDLRDSIFGFVARELERQRETDNALPPPAAEIINGTVKVGDWVLVAPDEDYGCLVGTVTAIEKAGTPEHDTDNPGDDIHVNFMAAEYSEKAKADFMEAFDHLMPDAASFDDLPLDDVIMAPESLISLAGLDFDHIGELSVSYRAAQDFARSVLGGHSDVNETEPPEQIQKPQTKTAPANKKQSFMDQLQEGKNKAEAYKAAKAAAPDANKKRKKETEL